MSGFINSMSGLKIPVLEHDPDDKEDGMLWYKTTNNSYMSKTYLTQRCF